MSKIKVVHLQTPVPHFHWAAVMYQTHLMDIPISRWGIEVQKHVQSQAGKGCVVELELGLSTWLQTILLLKMDFYADEAYQQSSTLTFVPLL